GGARSRSHDGGLLLGPGLQRGAEGRRAAGGAGVPGQGDDRRAGVLAARGAPRRGHRRQRRSVLRLMTQADRREDVPVLIAAATHRQAPAATPDDELALSRLAARWPGPAA